MTGTKNNVAIVANVNPPMTARPSGAFCSPPSPSPSAMGAMPMHIAIAVMMTGRMRTKPASIAAAIGSPSTASRSCAKLTTSTLLAVATPIHMIAPVSAGTDKVVAVANNIHTMPASAAGNAVMITNGSPHDWKFTTISR